MELINMYGIWFSGGVYLFSESASGSLNLEGRAVLAGEASDVSLQELSAFPHLPVLLEDLRGLLAPLGPKVDEQPLVFPHEQDAYSIYQYDGLSDRAYRFVRYHAPLGKAPSAECLAFVRRLPVLINAVEQGDFVTAGRVISRSRKLAQFPGLVKELLGQDAFLVLSLYYLNVCDPQKEALLGACFPSGSQGAGNSSGQNAGDSDYSKLYRLAETQIESRDLNGFYKESNIKIQNYLVDRRRPLVLPVVGTAFRKTQQDLYYLVEQVKREGSKRRLLEGLEGWDGRLKAYMEDLRVYLSPEPYNPHDSYAIAVHLQDDEGCRHLGYIKREMARILSPIVQSGITFTARLARLSSDSAEVMVWVE